MRHVVLLVMVAACGDEPAVCEDGVTPVFGAAAVLAPEIAEVEVGAGEVALLRTDAGRGLHLNVHDFDGISIGTAELGPADGSFEAGAAHVGPATFAVLWSAPLAGDRHELRFAEVEVGSAPRDERAWAASAERLFVHAVRRAGDRVAAVWNDGDEVKVGVAGAGAPTISTLGTGSAAALAADDDGGLAVAWADAADQVHVVRVGADGRPIGAPVDLGPLADYLPPAICWDGAAHVVAYTVRPAGTVGDVFTVRIVDGHAGEPRRLSDGTGTSWAPAIACRDGGYAVAWHHTTGGTIPGGDLVTSHIQYASIDATGAVTGPIVVEDVAGVQAMLPRIGTDGARDAVSWTQFGTSYQQKLATVERCAPAP